MSSMYGPFPDTLHAHGKTAHTAVFGRLISRANSVLDQRAQGVIKYRGNFMPLLFLPPSRNVSLQVKSFPESGFPGFIDAEQSFTLARAHPLKSSCGAIHK